MKLVEIHIARKQAEFARHPFFADLNAGLEMNDVLSFAPDLTFWVMAFQDIIRLNARMTRDADVRRIVRHHWKEDVGHDLWFLDDLALMKVAAPDVRWLFDKQHVPTRDAAYALISEVFRAEDDRLRLVLVKTLESAGHIFFERVAAATAKTKGGEGLKYFSFSHLEVEKDHEVFERDMAEKISSMQLPSEIREEAYELVDRCYAAFNGMFDAICASEHQVLGQIPAPARIRQARSRTQG